MPFETRGGEGADGNTRAPAVASGSETFQHERCTEVASSDGPGSSPIDGSWRRRAAKWGSRRRDGLRLPQEAALASNGSGKARARSFHRDAARARYLTRRESNTSRRRRGRAATITTLSAARAAAEGIAALQRGEVRVQALQALHAERIALK